MQIFHEKVHFTRKFGKQFQENSWLLFTEILENNSRIDEVDHEVEEARLSDVFEALIIGTLYCNQFKG